VRLLWHASVVTCLRGDLPLVFPAQRSLTRPASPSRRPTPQLFAAGYEPAGY
jgi:hypothetical protein